jgi:hypothetical protein
MEIQYVYIFDRRIMWPVDDLQSLFQFFVRDYLIC